MADTELKVKAAKKNWSDEIDFLILSKSTGGSRNVVTGLTMTSVREGCPIFDPSFTLGVAEAQALMDSLWDCGIRPTEGSGSAGAMRATERHLEDMRRLVFKGNEE